MCVPVRSFLPPRASRPRRTCSPRHGKLLYIIIVIFAENASFRSYGVICLPQMPRTTTEPQNTPNNGIPRNVGVALLFAVLTKNDSFRSYSTFVYLLRAHILNINTCTYTASAHEHESNRIKWVCSCRRV